MNIETGYIKLYLGKFGCDGVQLTGSDKITDSSSISHTWMTFISKYLLNTVTAV